MELARFGPDDDAAIRRYVEVANAHRDADAPWDHPLTVRGAVGRFRHGWDGSPPTPFLATLGGEVVGTATFQTGTWDNTHLAWVGVTVAPRCRGAGHGSAIVDALTRRAREAGCTSIGSDGWDDPRTRSFAARHGFAVASTAVMRRQTLAEIDWDQISARYEDARTQAAAYELVRRVGATPDDELPALAEMTAAINDQPLDDLEFEEEQFPPERVRAYEAAQHARGDVLHRVYARHRASGELAGQTVVVIDGERPELGEQHDTSVVRGHRGHRLGLLLKAAMLLWLRETRPMLATIDTWNAASNDHMIEVNDALGYRVVARGLEFQRSL